MFCKNCGTEVPEGAQFCPNCGQFISAPETAQQPPQPQSQPTQQPYVQTQQPYVQPQQPYVQPQPIYTQQPYQQPVYTQPAQPVNGTPVLVLGILSLVFAETGLIGLILGAVAKSKAKKILNTAGNLTGTAKVGNILATFGIIISIVMMVVWAIYFILLIAGTLAAGSGFLQELFDGISSI